MDMISSVVSTMNQNAPFVFAALQDQESPAIPPPDEALGEVCGFAGHELYTVPSGEGRKYTESQIAVHNRFYEVRARPLPGRLTQAHNEASFLRACGTGHNGRHRTSHIAQVV